MSTAAVALIVAVLGSLGTLASVTVNALHGRRTGRIDERRLGLEELQAVVAAQREELDDLRAARREDRGEIEQLRRDLRKAHDAIDKLTLAAEVRRT